MVSENDMPDEGSSTSGLDIPAPQAERVEKEVVKLPRPKTTSRQSSSKTPPEDTQKNSADPYVDIGLFQNTKKIKDITLQCLTEKRKADIETINEFVVMRVMGDPELSPYALKFGSVREILKSARLSLRASGKIGYHQETKLWFIKNTVTKPTSSEKNNNKINDKIQNQPPPKPENVELGPDWKQISAKSEAVKSAYASLSPPEFESFCLSLLKKHCGTPLKISERHLFSWTEGGMKDEGTLFLENADQKSGLEIIRCETGQNVTEEDFDRFVGILFKRGLQHGYIITPSIFSVRALDSVKTCQDKGMHIELIDENRLADLMLSNTLDTEGGFGLYQNGTGLLYLNETILKQSINSTR